MLGFVAHQIQVYEDERSQYVLGFVAHQIQVYEDKMRKLQQELKKMQELNKATDEEVSADYSDMWSQGEALLKSDKSSVEGSPLSFLVLPLSS